MTVTSLHMPEPPGPEQTLHYERSELGNARRLVDHSGQDLRHVPQLGHWYAWDGRRWQEDLTGEISRRAKQVAEAILDEAHTTQNDRLFTWGIRAQSNAGINNMINLASTEPGIPALIDTLDANPWHLCCANGTVDLRTGHLHPHDRSDLITKITPVAYRPDAQAPTWERFLTEIFAGDRDLIGFVQRMAGYSLTGDVTEQVMVFAHGSGRNGKTTLLNTIRHIAGDYGIQLDPTVLVADTHDQHPTGLTDLRGARFVATVETEQGKRLNESLVKQLTGGDPVRARRMRQDFFEFKPTHKLWFAGNHLPRISGTDIGIWRRLALVPFHVEFGPHKADKHLPEKLEEEAEGILAWAVTGCQQWQTDGLGIPASVTDATSAYRQSQDHLGRFITECCVTADTAYCVASELRTVYEKWCGEQGERPWTAQAIGRELTSRGYDQTTVGTGYDRKRAWLRIGIAAPENAIDNPPSYTEGDG